VGQIREGQGLFGPTQVLASAGVSNAGRPRSPIRLMAGLLYLKHSFNLSDEGERERAVAVLQRQRLLRTPRLPCDPTQIGRFRRDLGEEGLELLLKATIDTAVAIKAVKPKELERVIVDTTVQEKATAHPVDSRLLGMRPVKSS
jgi:IS5 family transposase